MIVVINLDIFVTEDEYKTFINMVKKYLGYKLLPMRPNIFKSITLSTDSKIIKYSTTCYIESEKTHYLNAFTMFNNFCQCIEEDN